MKFFNNLTVSGKVVIGLILTLFAGSVLYFGISALQKNGTLDDMINDQVASKVGRNEDADIVVAYNTFIGVAGLVYMNGGMEPNTESRMYKDYGIKLQIKQMDVVSDTREGLKTGIIDAAYCTVDALSIEMGSGSALIDKGIKVRMKVNESRGSDALVVNSSIKNITDLKGKKVAYAVGTASHTLLINILETAGMTIDDIDSYKLADGIESASAFKNKACDAALVWAPDDEECVKAVPGSKIFISTKTASSIIADGLLISDMNVEAKKDKFAKLMKAWLVGNSEMNDSPIARKEAVKLFSKGFDIPEDVAGKAIDKVRYSTLGDNKAFFGLEPTYTGVTGEKMYGRMSTKYTKAGLAKAPVAWSKVSDESLIEELLKDAPFVTDSKQSVEKEITFAAPTEADTKIVSNAAKKVSITFPTAGFMLDQASKDIIDREVTGVAQGLSSARIRIEGNTDATGDKQSNVSLSYKRAEAVVRYLVSEHGFNRNKFIVVGNGQSKPICTENNEDCYSKNRRTEFQFIW